MSADFATGCNAPVEFVIADLHLGDGSICGGRTSLPGSRKRPFESAVEMGREIMAKWNSGVRPHDTVYVLGDVGRVRHLGLIEHLNGNKHLIAGNGDAIAAISQTRLFRSISVARWLPGCLLTHIPVHESQLQSRSINVHGHLHGAKIADPRYVCVSVEHTGYRPVQLSDLLGHVGKRGSSSVLRGPL